LPSQNEWLVFENLLSELVSSPAVVLLETQIYILGGKVGEEPISRNLAYKAFYTVAIPIVQ